MKDSSSNPDEQTVQDWLVKIQGAIEGCVTLVYSTRLASILKNRAKLLKWKVKNATGSAKKMQYLQGLCGYRDTSLLVSNFTQNNIASSVLLCNQKLVCPNLYTLLSNCKTWYTLRGSQVISDSSGCVFIGSVVTEIQAC